MNSRENFTRRSEREGAALAVYHKGALVADLWGGFADRKTGSQWHRDTLASIFCCTKSVAAICVAMKVDQGECSYSDKVVKFWPEFKHNNKQDITIEMILTHRVSANCVCYLSSLEAPRVNYFHTF
ncbi:Beta-lactamase domain-containing protein [Trichostrongylus colubriformis]|uniref:Beta-lactamase domain-containing protein n=1 Tax=Trichostrongylus colubriformis TaxID=6319 RepID=A0AAN8J3R7_TRICO